jgi:hypothetical protein
MILYIPSRRLSGQMMNKRMLDWSIAPEHLNETNVMELEQPVESDHEWRLPLVLVHASLLAVDDEQAVGVDGDRGGGTEPLQPADDREQLPVVDIVRRAGPALGDRGG